MRQTRALLWMTSEPWEPGRLRYGWAAGRRPYGRGFSVNSVLSVVQTRLTLCCLCFLGVQKAAAHGLLPRSRLPSGRCHRVTAAFSHACTSKLAVGSWQRSEVGGRRSEGRGDGARPGRSLLRRRGGPARYYGRCVSRGAGTAPVRVGGGTPPPREGVLREFRALRGSGAAHSLLPLLAPVQNAPAHSHTPTLPHSHTVQQRAARTERTSAQAAAR